MKIAGRGRIGSLSFRLALWVGLLGLIQALVVVLFSYTTLERELDAGRRSILRDKVDQARHLLSDMPDPAAIRADAPRLAQLVAGHAELHMAVAAPGSAAPYIAFGPAATESLSRLRNGIWGTDAFLAWRAGDTGVPMLSFTAAGQTRSGQPYEVVITIDRAEDARLLHRLLATSATAAPFALALVYLSALAIVALGLRPLKRFRQAAADVSASDLSARIAIDGLPSELRSLGSDFNAMLDRLDDGVRRLSEFSGNLAHEMRTPLATLLGRTQVALSQPRSNEQLMDLLEGNVEELQRLSRLVSDMLFLAQADHAKNALNLVRLDLADEAKKVVEFLEVLADERDIAITVSGAAIAWADRQLLRRAITNLVSNAVRHGRPHTGIRVEAGTVPTAAMLSVVNVGAPIAAEHHSRLFDRFYRIDSSRARDSGGTGLGLAIVKAIGMLHGGSVQVTSGDDGEIRFTLVLPAAPKRSETGAAEPHAVDPRTDSDA